MLKDMRTYSQSAIDGAEKALRDTGLGSVSLDAFITSSQVEDREEEIRDEEEAVGESEETDPLNPGQYLHTLPWICDELNTQFCERGRLLCLPLDVGHPLGNHMVVSHEWSPQEKKAYNDFRILPTVAYSTELSERPCVVLRCLDLSDSRHAYPIMMREIFYTKPYSRQKFFLLGSIVPSQVLGASTTPLPTPYLFLPSEYTKLTAAKYLVSVDTEEGHNGEGYFRKTYKAINSIPGPKWSKDRTDALPLAKGSTFMSDKETDPRRYLIGLRNGSICDHLSELFEDGDTMQIVCEQSRDPNKMFAKRGYLCQVVDVLQAAWDFGCESIECPPS